MENNQSAPILQTINSDSYSFGKPNQTYPLTENSLRSTEDIRISNNHQIISKTTKKNDTQNNKNHLAFFTTTTTPKKSFTIPNKEIIKNFTFQNSPLLLTNSTSSTKLSSSKSSTGSPLLYKTSPTTPTTTPSESSPKPSSTITVKSWGTSSSSETAKAMLDLDRKSAKTQPAKNRSSDDSINTVNDGTKLFTETDIDRINSINNRKKKEKIERRKRNPFYTYGGRRGRGSNPGETFSNPFLENGNEGLKSDENLDFGSLAKMLENIPSFTQSNSTASVSEKNIQKQQTLNEIFHSKKVQEDRKEKEGNELETKNMSGTIGISLTGPNSQAENKTIQSILKSFEENGNSATFITYEQLKKVAPLEAKNYSNPNQIFVLQKASTSDLSKTISFYSLSKDFADNQSFLNRWKKTSTQEGKTSSKKGDPLEELKKNFSLNNEIINTMNSNRSIFNSKQFITQPLTVNGGSFSNPNQQTTFLRKETNNMLQDRGKSETLEHSPNGKTILSNPTTPNKEPNQEGEKQIDGICVTALFFVKNRKPLPKFPLNVATVRVNGNNNTVPIWLKMGENLKKYILDLYENTTLETSLNESRIRIFNNQKNNPSLLFTVRLEYMDLSASDQTTFKVINLNDMSQKNKWKSKKIHTSETIKKSTFVENTKYNASVLKNQRKHKNNSKSFLKNGRLIFKKGTHDEVRKPIELFISETRLYYWCKNISEIDLHNLSMLDIHAVLCPILGKMGLSKHNNIPVFRFGVSVDVIKGSRIVKTEVRNTEPFYIYGRNYNNNKYLYSLIEKSTNPLLDLFLKSKNDKPPETIKTIEPELPEDEQTVHSDISSMMDTEDDDEEGGEDVSIVSTSSESEIDNNETQEELILPQPRIAVPVHIYHTAPGYRREKYPPKKVKTQILFSLSEKELKQRRMSAILRKKKSFQIDNILSDQEKTFFEYPYDTNPNCHILNGYGDEDIIVQDNNNMQITSSDEEFKHISTTT